MTMLPTLLVPGFMADADLWTDVAPSLQSRGPLVHADLSQDDRIERMAQHVLTTAPSSFDLIGFSMGGYVARAIARLAPQRVRALVLIATSSRADTPTQAQRKVAAAHQLASPSQKFRGLSRASIASSVHPARANDEALIERIRAMGVRLGREAFLRQVGVDRESDLDRLAAIRCPTLVIAAAQDKLRGLDEAAELQAGIPGAVLQVIEGTGHMVPMEVPEALMQLVMPWLETAAPAQR